jgi:hypothetical protein
MAGKPPGKHRLQRESFALVQELAPLMWALKRQFIAGSIDRRGQCEHINATRAKNKLCHPSREKFELSFSVSMG